MYSRDDMATAIQLSAETWIRLWLFLSVPFFRFKETRLPLLFFGLLSFHEEVKQNHDATMPSAFVFGFQRLNTLAGFHEIVCEHHATEATVK